MIGQKRLKKLIENSDLKDFSKFIIIEGAKKSGKSLLVKKIADKVGYTVDVQNSIDSIRSMIATAYKVSAIPVLYQIKNAEKMSVPALNSILKVVEEPPKSAYFIMEVISIDNLLPTIISRAMILKLDPYLDNEIEDLAMTIKDFTESDLKVIKMFCRNFGDIKYLETLGIQDFNIKINNFFNDMKIMTGTDLLLLTDKMKLKEDGEGLDINFFLNSLEKLFLFEVKKVDKNLSAYVKAIRLISTYRNKINVKSINKGAVFDQFLLRLKVLWKNIK